MIRTDLAWIAQQVNGQLNGNNVAIEQVSTDTRDLPEGALYIALSGANFDGHAFIEQAMQCGAAALIVSQAVDTTLPYILVDDTRQALGRLGAAVKREVAPKTVGITGSSGKTTVKEMTAAILSRRGNVLATKGNFNNEIGVPLTLLKLEQGHDFAVIEMGANHLGEIAYTTSLVKPDVATIVNAAASHLEGFGSLFGVARAKSEIFKGIGQDGLALVNADSQFAQYWLGKLKRNNVQTFAPDNVTLDADFRAEDISIDLSGCAAFAMHTPIGQVSIHLPIPGTHNVGNALVAAALAIAVGATLDDVQAGLANMQQVAGRLNVKNLTNQVRLLDDTYNANVASVNAAIDTLASFGGKRILVLGDMAELGEKARFYHEQVGLYAREKGIDSVYTLGVLSQSASSAFAGEGFHFGDLDKLVAALEQELLSEQRDISILIKGSRSSRMERVVKALEESPVGKLERRRERIAC